MSFIPVENIGGELAAKWLPTVLPVASSILCGAMVAEKTGEGEGIVQADGLTVDLGAWYSAVHSVNYDGEDVAYTFTPDKGDIDYVTGLITEAYGHTLTLETKLEPGTVLKIQGTYGFKTIPESLQALLASMIRGLEDASTGADRITSKSIEDVSVSYQRDTTTPVLAKTVESFASVISIWALCDKPLGVGRLAMPRTMPAVPYWLGDGDGLDV